jgi:hypothetical protein
MRYVLTITAIMAATTMPALATNPPAPERSTTNINNNSARASSSASARATSLAIAAQKQQQQQSTRVRQANAQSNNQEINHKEVKQAPGFAAPGLTAFGGCKGSISGGFSIAGFGAAAGTTINDEDCRRLNNGTWLYQAGEKDAALALVCDNDGVRAALNKVGRVCPGDKPIATTTPTATPTAPVNVTASSEKHPACTSRLINAEAFTRLGC